MRRVDVLKSVVQFEKDGASFTGFGTLSEFGELSVMVERVKVGAEVVAKVEPGTDVFRVVRPELADSVLCCPLAEVLMREGVGVGRVVSSRRRSDGRGDPF